MKPALVYLLFLASSVLCPAMLYAQYNNRNAIPDNELYLSEGIISGAEANGWNGPPLLGGYVSFPSALTGAIFLTYRHFFTKRFALGFTAGLDFESGDLSYGNPNSNSTGLEGTNGHYSVHAYTIAPEALLAYFRKATFMLYGYAGAGVTFYDNKCTLYSNIPNVTLPSNPYDYRVTNFNFQVTPIGFRFGGDIGGFVELGLGYKGIFSGGLSARL
jgi:hypothetical protein